MSEQVDILTQDIEAIIEAFDEEDYNLMNIFSNRFMSNSIFSKEGVNFLPGFIYKNISQDFNRLKNLRTDTLSTAKAECKTILEKIRAYYLDAKKEPTDLWGVYLEYFLKIREHKLNEIEKKVYKINYNFTELTFRWLLNFLDENKDFMLNERNMLLNGIINEMDRILKCHSVRLRDVVTYSLIRALEYLETYVRFEKSDKGNEKIFSILHDIIIVLSKDELDLKECNFILNNILTEWRMYFIRFMEVRIKREIQIEKPIQLPEDVKEKISESISKTLEEKI